jgi:hypothetical protein
LRDAYLPSQLSQICHPQRQRLSHPIRHLSSKTPSNSAMLFKNSLSTSRQQNKELRLQWIPSHCNNLGNKKADFLAKAATKKPPPPTSKLTFNTVKKRIKSTLKKIFKRDKKKESGKSSWWEEIKKGPDKSWSSKTATSQFRLATGHDVLQSHLNR